MFGRMPRIGRNFSGRAATDLIPEKFPARGPRKVRRAHGKRILERDLPGLLWRKAKFSFSIAAATKRNSIVSKRTPATTVGRMAIRPRTAMISALIPAHAPRRPLRMDAFSLMARTESSARSDSAVAPRFGELTQKKISRRKKDFSA